MKIKLNNFTDTFQWIIILVLDALFLFANIGNSKFGILAVIIVYFCLIVSNCDNCLCMVFFLIPNIRIADCTGLTSLVNVAFVVAGLKIIFSTKKISEAGAIVAATACLFTFIHFSTTAESISYFVKSINLVFDVVVSAVLFTDEAIKVKYGKLNDYLIIGIISSFVIFLISYKITITNIINGYRVAGFGDDPNYFSIYVLTSVALLLYSLKKEGCSVRKFVMLAVLSFIGICTLSKMFIILFSFIIMMFIITSLFERDNNGIKATLVMIFSAIAIFLIKGDTISNIFFKTIERFSRISNTAHDFVYTVSTGRSAILMNYIGVFLGNVTTFIFGKGLSYNQYYGAVFGDYRMAHNTYFDMLLSWGCIGTIIFIVAYAVTIKKSTSKGSHDNGFCYIPLMTLMISFVALSCLTSDMIWYMLVIATLPLRENNIIQDKLIKESL